MGGLPDDLFLEFLAVGGHEFIPIAPSTSVFRGPDIYCDRGGPQHGDIVEALMYGFLHEKYTRRIEICTIFELPRDYHSYAYLAKIAGEMVMIDVHHDQYGRIRVEDLAEVIKYKRGNESQCGATKLHIYVSSESRSALRFTAEVKQYIASQVDVTVFPVLYRRSPMHWLSELDFEGCEVDFGLITHNDDDRFPALGSSCS